MMKIKMVLFIGLSAGLLACSNQAPVSNQTNTVTSTSAPQVTASTTVIDGTKAKEIALQDANVTEENTKALSVKRDYDDGRTLFEVKFYVENQEYDYEINEMNGNILKKETSAHKAEWELTDDVKSEEEITTIVLGRVSGASSQNIYFDREYDDGRRTYEGTLVYDNRQYDFEIDALTGDILSWEEESLNG